MKKIFIILLNIIILSVFILASKINLDATIGDLSVEYGKTNNEYFNKSKCFVFSYDKIDYKKLNYSIDFVFNIEDSFLYKKYLMNPFGEKQYILYESIKNKYLIYDIMINEISEYSVDGYSPFFEYLDQECIYAGPGRYLYLVDNGLIDILTNSNLESDLIISAGSEILLEEEENLLFQNRVILDEFLINNYYYFDFFHMPSAYNQNNSCTFFAFALLMTYLDTFFDNNLVKDVCPDGHNSYYTFSRSDCFLNNVECFDGGNHKDVLGPSLYFHNYLISLGISGGFTHVFGSNNNLTGMSVSILESFLWYYLQESEVSFDLSSDYSFFTIDYSNEHIVELLEDNNPVIIQVLCYDYYYQTPSGYCGAMYPLGNHSIVAYGYQNTNVGNFYITHFGWLGHSKVYINQVFGVEYLSVTSNSPHHCSSNYKFKVPSSSTEVSMCPCHSFDYYFDFIIDEYNLHDDYDMFYYPLTNEYFYLDHIYIVHQTVNDAYHYDYCYFAPMCGKRHIGLHDYYAYQNYDILNHYHKCSECNHSYHDNWSISYDYNMNENFHCDKCNDCNTYFNIENHNISYTGDINNHIRHCSDCPYIDYTTPHIIDTESISPRYHNYLCNCGYSEIEEHDFDLNLICLECGYVHDEHFYDQYFCYNSNKHYGYCLCGNQIIEAHNMVNHGIGQICSKCSYYTEDFHYIDTV